MVCYCQFVSNINWRKHGLVSVTCSSLEHKVNISRWSHDMCLTCQLGVACQNLSIVIVSLLHWQMSDCVQQTPSHIVILFPLTDTSNANRDQINWPLLFQDRISNCTNLLRPELNWTAHEVVGFVLGSWLTTEVEMLLTYIYHSTTSCVSYRVWPMYTSDIKKRQHRSTLEHGESVSTDRRYRFCQIW